MTNHKSIWTNHFDRRTTLALLGGAGVSALARLEAASQSCLSLTPAIEEGPYFVEEKLHRSDVRTDPATGVAQQGAQLTLAVTVQNQSGGICAPLVRAQVDIWHANAAGGLYSDEAAQNTVGQKYLRGYQITDGNGLVQFTTIYPGWYSGRTTHIHIRVRTYSGSTVLSDFETQAFFSDAITDAVYAQAPYNSRGARDTRNSSDHDYNVAGASTLNVFNVTTVSTGYAATLSLSVSETQPPVSAPSIVSGGVASAASGIAGVSPGSWVSIYGANLSASTYTMTTADVVNSTIPTTLGGVSASIDSKPAFVYFVSPSQLNVLAPSDANAGSVPVTVTTSAGTSNVVTATLQQLMPAFFTASNYALAVRASDGAVAASVKAGDVLQLYGTGFGPANTTIAAGTIFAGAYPTASPVTVTIGGITALVSFSGLAGPGLYQINLTVPAGVAVGDNRVVAAIGGVSSPSTALLKIVSA